MKWERFCGPGCRACSLSMPAGTTPSTSTCFFGQSPSTAGLSRARGASIPTLQTTRSFLSQSIATFPFGHATEVPPGAKVLGSDREHDGASGDGAPLPSPSLDRNGPKDLLGTLSMIQAVATQCRGIQVTIAGRTRRSSGVTGFGSGTVVGVGEFAEVDVGATVRCPVQAGGHVVEPLPDAHEIQIEIRPGAIRQLDRIPERVVAVDRSERELDAAPGSAQLLEEELGAAHHGLRPGAQTATREPEPVVQLSTGSVVVERLRQVRLPGRAQPHVKAAELLEQPQVRLCASVAERMSPA